MPIFLRVRTGTGVDHSGHGAQVSRGNRLTNTSGAHLVDVGHVPRHYTNVALPAVWLCGLLVARLAYFIGWAAAPRGMHVRMVVPRWVGIGWKTLLGCLHPVSTLRVLFVGLAPNFLFYTGASGNQTKRRNNKLTGFQPPLDFLKYTGMRTS